MRTIPGPLCIGLLLVGASTRAQPPDDEVERTVSLEALTARDLAPTAALECDLRNLQPPAAWSLNVQEGVATALTRSAACLTQRDAACAEQAIASITAERLSDDENALIAIQKAEVANLGGDTETAARLFAEAMELPALSPFLARDIAQKLAATRYRAGDRVAALRLLAASFACDTWTADALTVRGLAYQDLAATANALESFEAAMRLYRLQGRSIPVGLEGRYQALAASYDPTAPPRDDVVPLVRVNPSYPDLALRRRREGWVQLEFTISDTGAVTDARAIASSDEMFEEAALAALRRWRYAPRFENGMPVNRSGVQTIIRFCLDACGSGIR